MGSPYRGHHWDPAGCPVYSGTQLAVLYREVSLIHRYICAQLYVVGTADSVLIREMSSIYSGFYREVPGHPVK